MEVTALVIALAVAVLAIALVVVFFITRIPKS